MKFMVFWNGSLLMKIFRFTLYLIQTTLSKYMRKLQDKQVRTEFGKHQNMQNNNKTYFDIANII